jgi:hypothetical protein
MAKRTKTFKIGEYCVGGIITVEITGKILTIINKDWDTSAGYTRRSNQSKAKELSRGSVVMNDEGWGSSWRMKAFMYLTELTTAYYADKILDWVEKK